MDVRRTQNPRVSPGRQRAAGPSCIQRGQGGERIARVGSKEKVRQFLLSNLGRVVESREIQAAADGAVQYSRRLRELRDEDGWPILSHLDTTDLKPGQYLLRE